MDLVVADNRTVPYIYLLNVIVAEEDLKLMKYVSVLSQRYENLRIKPEESQKEREAVGGRGMLGRTRSPSFPWDYTILTVTR